ncbi:N-acetylglucosamine-1-phosphodiester alpha-N-acetylglucosaminidase isoform X2 [Onychostruthus taczanowskii]|uniref:N-acetylglucosamine-1-phosphodiester alpha-N-acetylglucosaminidase isoform X2 n=1 Tax=Onychostruthus taczanowskii TaxID=356909 RepID=UPI001B8073C3|nr:N-acetylglucosamine-1-phosphodiester alpha-N-acetylglucosaminidase isoform X2 [Onychostruthus taczanowskii]XP_041259794.1 N-acetylglucosamine-1-phosphodiester alpha-N-acetylglucosaminidase isoform X2 [Onychostruthus taczanowskii]XP_041259803.1 N-acetylglucosamine-1-phosphodiester alpha-N-acetylglucosaminidase isoform X2 [Onychostruthus taczanowskii]XP_041259819.1 N-acetylglucosamine-1-phosphodiester alpha-N-acetylglucosaminidase isoform X2 [Onychostruthus taczanowskii]XP_041259828.1 N-acetyl
MAASGASGAAGGGPGRAGVGAGPAPGRGSGRAGVGTVLVAALAVLGSVQVARGAGSAPGEPLLQPYPPGRHGPRHGHRHVRDCQPVKYGNVTHEAWPGDNSTAGPVAVTRTFVSYIHPEGSDRKVIYGHFTFARNPLSTVSVLEPGGAGGCLARRRAPVEETAKLRKCLVAQNGGYFNMETGECLGNVVSDGRLVRDSGGLQNAQFGIRKDGTMVFGYLSEEDVLDQSNPFVQLVSGVVWLLRDGEVYVNQSRAAECGDTQSTGTFDRFINVISARTAVGHDRQGRLVLVHVDGQTESRGVDLWEMAEFLKQQGVINAINLDGGGSATLVLNGTLANYPSEHCSFDSMWRCPRSISTVVCVHEPGCDPPDCSGHGLCVAGHCHCHGPFWAGPACDTLDCGPANCSLRGVCSAAGCLCDAGWTGSNCTEACVPGSYGESCSQKCRCLHGSSCDPVHGACSCPAGFYGTSCEHECPLGWFGPSCQSRCACDHSCPCDPETGSCNITHHGALQDHLHRAGQCLASQEKSKEKFSLSESSWLSLSSALALLLVLSALGNVGLVLRGRRRQRDRDYRYHPLRDINGDTPHRPTSAAWDQEDIQELEDTQEPEDTQDPNQEFL